MSGERSKASMLRAAFVQVANTLQLAQHVGRHIVADALGMTKLQIQHRPLR